MTAMIAFHVTDRCQLNCAHCLRDPGKQAKDIDVDVVVRALDEVVRTYHVRHVALTGGEPTLHPRFRSIVDAITARGFTFHFVSNGKNLGRILEEIDTRALTAVNLSLDGADEETHDGIRGAGSYREVMAAASVCVVRGLPFVLQMTVHAKNAQQIEAMGMLAAQLKAARLSFVMMQPTGTHHDASLFLSAAAWHQVQDRIARLHDVLKLPITTPEGFAREQPFHVCEPMQSRVLHVDVAGRLTLCCQHSGVPGDGSAREVAGDLHEVPFVQAHQRLLTIIHDAQQERLTSLARPAEEQGPWNAFPCNACMKSFGKPHWTDDGVGGPAAQRARWQGAWAPLRMLP